jgi:hypothetical protein
MLLISNAKLLGELMAPHGSKYPSITIAVSSTNCKANILEIIGFWVLDLANNTVQGPCRALLVDTAPANQQNLGGFCFSFMMGTTVSFKLTTRHRESIGILCGKPEGN